MLKKNSNRLLLHQNGLASVQYGVMCVMFKRLDLSGIVPFLDPYGLSFDLINCYSYFMKFTVAKIDLVVQVPKIRLLAGKNALCPILNMKQEVLPKKCLGVLFKNICMKIQQVWEYSGLLPYLFCLGLGQ